MLRSKTWLNKDINFSIKSFGVVKKGRTNSVGGGVAILVSNNIKYKTLNNLYNSRSKIELCAIQIYEADSELILISCYRPPDQNIDKSLWVRFLSQFAERFLVVGDFNTPHLFWDDRISCDKGKNYSMYWKKRR